MAVPRKPDWLRVRIPSGTTHENVRRILNHYGLHTVCEEAHCPNIGECWGGGTATFMIMGDVCTRGCRFCAVTSGKPGGFLDPFEPHRLSRAVSEMGLNYVVVTSVCRDDLSDGGAAHFAETIRAVREAGPETRIEVLIPDFRGSVRDIKSVVEARPDVIAHNVETTRKLTPLMRDPRASYSQSLSVLRTIKRLDGRILTKSSLMLGVGEQDEEVVETMRHLRSESVDILTMGQYLRPSKRNIQVHEFVHPGRFQYFKNIAEEMGFLLVVSGPLVRSSYRAGEFFVLRFLDEEGFRSRALDLVTA